MDLPRDIRERTPAPHALRVGVRRAELPPAGELAAFSAEGNPSPPEFGSSWIRVAWKPGADTLLVLLEEGKGPGERGFDHSIRVESGRSKSCFLAAYFIARRCGGVVRIRQRAELLAASAFAERFLDAAELEARWARAVKSEP